MLHKRDEYPSRLSGGQKQRVAIARALSMDPQVLMFDEPTSALDPELVGEVLLVMKTLAHEGSTMIVVSHEMQFCREAADRVLFMEGGVVVEEGPPEQVLNEPQQEATRQFLRRFLDCVSSVRARSDLAQIRLAHILVGGQGGGRVGEQDLAGLEHVAPIGDGQGLHRVLLHQQDGDALLVDLRDEREDLLHQDG